MLRIVNVDEGGEVGVIGGGKWHCQLLLRKNSFQKNVYMKERNVRASRGEATNADFVHWTGQRWRNKQKMCKTNFNIYENGLFDSGEDFGGG